MIILGKSLQQERESPWEIFSLDQFQKGFNSSLLIDQKKNFPANWQGGPAGLLFCLPTQIDFPRCFIKHRKD